MQFRSHFIPSNKSDENKTKDFHLVPLLLTDITSSILAASFFHSKLDKSLYVCSPCLQFSQLRQEKILWSWVFSKFSCWTWHQIDSWIKKMICIHCDSPYSHQLMRNVIQSLDCCAGFNLRWISVFVTEIFMYIQIYSIPDGISYSLQDIRNTSAFSCVPLGRV